MRKAPKIDTLLGAHKPFGWAMLIGAFGAFSLSQVARTTDHLFNSCYCSKGIPIKSRQNKETVHQ